MKHPPNNIGKYMYTCRQPVECVINHILTLVSITPMEGREMYDYAYKNRLFRMGGKQTNVTFDEGGTD